ncbi:hypothetical protein C8P65_10721 [Capnocytophaga leadbetteri]|jgi:hypothetical protein|uniref:Hydrolase n=1 Tax=Capnocytophaga leadbetteri TaxID=327575 RepID=A0A2T5XTW5_9FLAO|nr:hypothetical protein [Capnocytophaga leadbetteri]PTX06365.1 hypothetical protein C8P65_10721 [Capnocytophaga leadbetteri]
MNKQFITLLGTMSLLVGCNNSQPQMSATQLNETAQIISKLTDSIRKLTDERDEALNFSLETNELSQQYFEDLKIVNPSQIVINALMELNIKEKNPYIKSESNGRFLINKIRILNEKWVICEFSDGELWGDLLLEYHIDGNQKPTFKTLDEVIHPK